MTRTVQITDIEFDCSLDDSDWSEKDKFETERNLPQTYIGAVLELELSNDATDDEIIEELLNEVSYASGWCINDISFRHIPS